MSLFLALSSRPFALLWTGRTISRVGDSFYLVALAWWVVVNTGSAAAMGSVLIAASLPMLTFLLLGGVVSDRLPRLSLMLASDLIRFLAVGIAALLAGLHQLHLPALLALSALFGLVDAFFYPAYSAVVPEIVPVEMLPSANSLRSLSGRAASLVGPALAAATVAGGSISLAFALDAVSFLSSAACIIHAARDLPSSRPAEGNQQSMMRDLREGIGAVLAIPWLWLTITVAGLSNITMSGPLEAVLPFLIKHHLHAGVGVYGLAQSLEAAGSVLIAAWLGRQTSLRRRGPIMYGAWLLAALMVALMGLPIGVPGVLIAILVAGGALGTLNLVWATTLQVAVPRHLQGRINSIDLLGSAGLEPVGLAVAGFAADRIGSSPVFLLGGVVSATIIVVALLHPAIRNLD